MYRHHTVCLCVCMCVIKNIRLDEKRTKIIFSSTNVKGCSLAFSLEILTLSFSYSFYSHVRPQFEAKWKEMLE